MPTKDVGHVRNSWQCSSVWVRMRCDGWWSSLVKSGKERTKISNGIKAQTNKSSAIFKLFIKMPQNNQPFVNWYPWLEKQADKVDWDAFGKDDALTLTIMYQTNNRKL